MAAGALPDPWGVSQEAWESIEANLFAASLFPYLAFLWLLDRPETECPPRVSFAFKFLLVFVFATIPAGIYAKLHYGTILANVDWLHGTAESLLTVTNLLLVISLRDAVNSATGGKGTDSDLGSVKGALLGLTLAVTLLGSTAAPLSADALLAAAPDAATTAAAATEQLSLSSGLLPLIHDEPSNALSIPTWAVHTSSVIEYLVAMGLVWNYAEATDNPRWKGLTWGMLPLHSSGITACVYHLFYNSPSLNALVALQASLTVIGNTTCAAAAFRIWREGVDRLESSGEASRASASSSSSAQKRGVEEEDDDDLLAPGWEDLGEAYKGRHEPRLCPEARGMVAGARRRHQVRGARPGPSLLRAAAASLPRNHRDPVPIQRGQVGPPLRQGWRCSCRYGSLIERQQLGPQPPLLCDSWCLVPWHKGCKQNTAEQLFSL